MPRSLTAEQLKSMPDRDFTTAVFEALLGRGTPTGAGSPFWHEDVIERYADKVDMIAKHGEEQVRKRDPKAVLTPRLLAAVQTERRSARKEANAVADRRRRVAAGPGEETARNRARRRLEKAYPVEFLAFYREEQARIAAEQAKQDPRQAKG